METKKNPSIDLRRKSPLFFQMGMLTAISLVLFSFELKQYEKPRELIPTRKPGTTLEETIIPTKPEPPQAPIPPRQIPTTIINIVDIPDLPDIPIFDFPEFTPNSTIPVYVSPPKKTKHTTVDPLVLIPEVQASFKGGDAELFAFLGHNLRYPPPAVAAGIEGTVWVEFTVEKDGSITDIAIRQGNLGGGCEEAAMDVVGKMPPWIPARQRNRPVRSRFVLPISFVLVK